jgi:paired amphipathic helix protein Sin3a
LNDEYVSHPTWASEDSGFIASKKNQFEEALHRVEDERYDFDLNIDATLNTLSLLEPISKRMNVMSEAQKKALKLTPGIGGKSITIYQRVIRKVYGDEKGREIIDMLHDSPCQTAPVVVKRLRQKEEEWKKSQVHTTVESDKS